LISVDAKRKELIGNYKQTGQAWVAQPDYVNVHDFSLMSGSAPAIKAVPYGIYDLANNCVQFMSAKAVIRLNSL
jgi:hypothetical protein